MRQLFLILVLSACPLLSWATSPEDFYNAGMDLLMKQHDYSKAAQYFRAAVDQRHDYWQAYQFLGEAYFQAGDLTQAAMAMEVSLKLHPDNKGLRDFLNNKVKRNSPWVAKDRWNKALPVLSFLISCAALGISILGPRLRSRDGSPKA